MSRRSNSRQHRDRDTSLFIWIDLISSSSGAEAHDYLPLLKVKLRCQSDEKRTTELKRKGGARSAKLIGPESSLTNRNFGRSPKSKLDLGERVITHEPSAVNATLSRKSLQLKTLRKGSLAFRLSISHEGPAL